MVRNLEDDIKSRLRVLAARHGRSMEEERAILRDAVGAPARPSGGVGTEIAALSTASISAEPRRTGRPGESRDSMIAGIAIATCGSLVTRNTRHFDDRADNADRSLYCLNTLGHGHNPSPPPCIAPRFRVEAAPGTQPNQGAPVQRNTIAAVWIGGLVLAAALYAIGPDRFVEACLDLMNGIDAVFRNLVLTLGVQVFGIVRALAIAIYAVFFILAAFSIARGTRGVWALIVVTVIFVMLVGRPDGDFTAPVGRWILALALVLTGAAVMTQRLLAPRFGRGLPPPPYPPGYRP